MKSITLFIAVFSTVLVAGTYEQVQSRSVVGFLRCPHDGEPTGWIREDIVGTSLMLPIVAHERDHVRLAKLFPNCRAFDRWASKAENMRIVEASAHCAAAKVTASVYKDMLLWDAAAIWATELRHYSIFKNFTLEQVTDHIIRYCDYTPNDRDQDATD
jgi:hypothetical protein